jgi:hypothetical protein
MSRKEVRSDASPFTTPHAGDKRGNGDGDDDGGKKDKRKAREGAATPVLASQLQKGANVTAEERLMKTLRGDDGESSNASEEEEDDDDDGEGFMEEEDIRTRAERALNLGDGDDERAARTSSSRSMVQNNTVIGTVHGDVYIGGKVGAAAAAGAAADGVGGRKMPWTSLTEEDKAHIKVCAKSRRLLEEGDLMQIASKIGNDWRSVGEDVVVVVAVVVLH